MIVSYPQLQEDIAGETLQILRAIANQTATYTIFGGQLVNSTIVDFRTEAFKTAPRFPIPEIYLAPTSGFIKETAQFAELAKPDFKTGDAYKASQKLYELSTVENPPLRLVLGQDAIGSARGHLEGVLNEITAYESWSADLRED